MFCSCITDVSLRILYLPILNYKYIIVEKNNKVNTRSSQNFCHLKGNYFNFLYLAKPSPALTLHFEYLPKKYFP